MRKQIAQIAKLRQEKLDSSLNEIDSVLLSAEVSAKKIVVDLNRVSNNLDSESDAQLFLKIWLIQNRLRDFIDSLDGLNK